MAITTTVTASTALAGSRSPQPGAGSTKPNRRLPGVDGLRAAAALWVVLFHIEAFSGARLPVPGLAGFIRSGSAGVSLFLVLSGFCLYLPFAAGQAHKFKTGQFFKRRCWRLLPAYYASLIFAVCLAVPLSHLPGGTPLTVGRAAWQVLTHLSLTHTLFPSTFYALNGAYWSLGLEWELYLGLPLLIWGISRYGLFKTVAVAIAINVVYRLALGVAISAHAIDPGGALASVVLPNQLPGRWAEFVLGMVAAELYAAGHVARWKRWSAAGIALLIPLALLALASSGWQLSHLLYGCVFFVLLALVLAENNLVSSLFAWGPLVALGTMSYSLYLVHQPLIQLSAYVIQTGWHASGLATFAILVLLLPVVVFIAWLLFITVERRTLKAPGPGANALPTQLGRIYRAILPR